MPDTNPIRASPGAAVKFMIELQRREDTALSCYPSICIDENDLYYTIFQEPQDAIMFRARQYGIDIVHGRWAAVRQVVADQHGETSPAPEEYIGYGVDHHYNYNWR